MFGSDKIKYIFTKTERTDMNVSEIKRQIEDLNDTIGIPNHKIVLSAVLAYEPTVLQYLKDIINRLNKIEKKLKCKNKRAK